MSLLGESNYSVESDGQLPLVVQASSAAAEGTNSGIAIVDFYIDNQRVGSATNNEGNLFQTILDLDNLVHLDENKSISLRQGEHEITVVARDKLGNYAGTFSNRLTNLVDRTNRALHILPPLPKDPPVIELRAPESEITVNQGSSIRVSAYASDPDRGLKGVKFIAGTSTLHPGMVKLILMVLCPAMGSLLRIGNGTGNIPVTMEFDWDDDVAGEFLSQPIPSIANEPGTVNPVATGAFNYPCEVHFLSQSGWTTKFQMVQRWRDIFCQ